MTARSSPELADALLAVRPQRAYVVCATPRSGSTLLCEMLADCGIAGRPSEHVEQLRKRGRPNEPREYFADVEDRSVLELLPASGPPRPHSGAIDERLAALIAYATTPNGVFGTKVMWSYMADLQERLAELPGFGRLQDADRLAGLLGDVQYVHVLREDHVAQAISMWRAVQTRAWRAETDDAVEPVYSFSGIEHLAHQLERHNVAWDRWFDQQEIEPLRVRYSEMAEDPGRVLQDTLDFIGVGDQAHAEPPPPSMRRQSGEQSREWADRYRREEEAHR
jgi:trehalose 2-sulfotransferase